MTLDFNDDRTYTKDVVLANVRYALFDPKSLQDDAFSAEFLDMATVFVLMDHSDPNRPRYKTIDAVDMVSLDIKLNEIMEAANENCKKAGYKIMLMEDAISELTGIEISNDAFCPMYIGTNPERMLGASILMYETYLEELAAQIEDDLCIAPSSIHEVLIFPLSLIHPAKIIEAVRDVNQTVVSPQEKLSDSAYIYRRGTHAISQATLKRIRKNREFFNIRPEEAFRYLKLIAEMDDTAEINAPEDEQGSSETESSHPKSNTHLGDYTVETDEIFYLSNGVADGKMKVQNGCEYVVLEGSVLDPKITSSESNIRKSRKEHADSLSEDGTVVIRDIIFNTPSGAANFIRGGACNGKTYWRTASDRPLSEFISYRKDNSDN